MASRSGLRQVFRVGEFRALWGAELASVAGDQLARVALTVLVYGRTSSAAWAAATYALTFLPALLGGVLLGGLADRYRRREVMVLADVIRAGLVGLIAIPSLPLWLLCAVLAAVVLLAGPHTAAQGALLPDVLPGHRYEQGLAVRQITNQSAQLVGFAMGGTLVAVFSPTVALLADAFTFALSAVLVRVGVSDRPAPATPSARAGPRAARRFWNDAADGLRVVLTEPRRRVLACLAWLVGCYIVPEGLAAPYAAEIGAGPAVVGLLMAADPAGSVLGAWLFTRFVPTGHRERWLGPLAIAAGLPLVLCVARPDAVPAILLWGATGLLSTACLVQAQASFVRMTPYAQRGKAIGLAASGLVAAQGLAVLLSGFAAEHVGAAAAVAITGAVGSATAIWLAVAWRRAGRIATSPPDAAASRGSPEADVRRGT